MIMGGSRLEGGRKQTRGGGVRGGEGGEGSEEQPAGRCVCVCVCVCVSEREREREE